MSHKVVRECLYPLQTPEAVTAFTSGDLPVNVHGQQFYDKYAIIILHIKRHTAYLLNQDLVGLKPTGL